MKLVDAEPILGEELLTFYYMSEERVDFRELVKSLAAEFKTRIEMRQVGRPRRSPAGGRLRALRAALLLQELPEGAQAGIDEGGQAPEGDAGSPEDLRPLDRPRADADHRHLSCLPAADPGAGLRRRARAGRRKRGAGNRAYRVAALCARRGPRFLTVRPLRLYSRRSPGGRRSGPDHPRTRHADVRLLGDHPHHARHHRDDPRRGQCRIPRPRRAAAAFRMGRDDLLGATLPSRHGWCATMPGLAIFIVSLGFNLLGDGLRDVLDPRSAER